MHELGIETALGMAVVREKRRLAQIHAELGGFKAAGYPVAIEAIDLMRLERNGFVYDFDSGTVLDMEEADAGTPASS